MSVISRLLPSANKALQKGLGRTAKTPITKAATPGKSSTLSRWATYGLDQYAANALQKKLGQPDGIIEKLLHFVRPDLYNAYKTAKLATPKGGLLRLGLVLLGLKFPLRMTAFMLAKQSGKGVGLIEWASILFAPRWSIVANAGRKDVFNGASNVRELATNAVTRGLNAVSGGASTTKGSFWNRLATNAQRVIDNVLPKQKSGNRLSVQG